MARKAGSFFKNEKSKKFNKSKHGGKIEKQTSNKIVSNGIWKSKGGRSSLRTISKVSTFAQNENEELHKNSEKIEANTEVESDAEKYHSNEKRNNRNNNNAQNSFEALVAILENENDHNSIQYNDKIALNDRNISNNSDELLIAMKSEDDTGNHSENDSENDESDQDNQEVEDSDEGEPNLEIKLGADPFDYHFSSPDSDVLDRYESFFEKNENSKWLTNKYLVDEMNYMVTVNLPPIQNELSLNRIQEDCTLRNYQNYLKNALTNYHIKSRLKSSLELNNFKLSNIQKLLIDPMFTYKDIVFPYYDYLNESEVRDLYSVHVINHVYKTRDRILKNNTKMSAYKEKLRENKNQRNNLNDSHHLEEPDVQDQGFHRPKALILLPSRNCCFDLIKKMVKITNLKQENRKKFETQFADDSLANEFKPKDFQYLFKGNNHDFFYIGIKFTRKSIKFYSSFNQSDVILASPLGLKGFLESNLKKKEQEEFLSSIEILVIDQANTIQFQNWSNISFILPFINKKLTTQPKDLDFSRVRMWAINDNYKLLRQNLIFCKFLTPEINNLLSYKNTLNLSGKVKFKKIFKSELASINKIGFKVKQYFTRFNSSSPLNDADERFKYFKMNVVSSILKQQHDDQDEGGTLIYISSYYEYLRIKDYLSNKTSLDFTSIDEYSTQSKLSRNRDLFFKNRYKIILYTERLHFYNRFDIKGVKNIIFYNLPSDEVFYSEIILRYLSNSMLNNIIKDINLCFVRVLYSKWDQLLLEKIVGEDKTPIMCYSNNETYEFR
ncbi:rRNA-binding ribosome biosynthesis protein UTP25 [Ascoidea rubescens DSM 1968]|uniref:U3 small nucleolar RNA-associated protein 25 n=1 Tax=Ascoidea rubescens DSM 1968 TaxID=1344418 RepID=A0A1D2VHB5_9ASCO|nr:DUF1253-domain-containing protein [Ascoidea rubescens DSM 1968]ODV61044.1 DUF1253-domain-containing protein [Ascoidea rubescens DSM 1968]